MVSGFLASVLIDDRSAVVAAVLPEFDGESLLLVSLVVLAPTELDFEAALLSEAPPESEDFDAVVERLELPELLELLELLLPTDDIRECFLTGMNRPLRPYPWDIYRRPQFACRYLSIVLTICFY